jgi:hypothetical protein
MVLAALMMMGCDTKELCLVQRDLVSKEPYCSEEVCVDTSAPLEIRDNFATATALTCSGWNEGSPSYLLMSLANDESSGVVYDPERSRQLYIGLDGTWDRTFNPTSLNAALIPGSGESQSALHGFATPSSVRFSNMEHATDTTSLEATLYTFGPGDIAQAVLDRGRVRLEIHARLVGAAMLHPLASCSNSMYNGDSCSCGWLQGDSPVSERRVIKVDLPYWQPCTKPPEPVAPAAEKLETAASPGP